MIIKAGSIRKGMYILFKNEPALVTKTDFMSPGKGSAFMRAKFKNLKTGKVQEFTHKSTESVEEIEISSVQMQYLYLDGTDLVFMNPETYDQVEVPQSLIGDKVQLLIPESKVYIMTYDDKPIGVSFPQKINLKVIYAEEAVAGNTMGTAKKEIKLETGLVVLAPIFIKEGETVVIDTETLSFVSRA
ncbi:MAG: elongation factor P [Candidatus Pacebacteria bacterium CG_4_10_14_3_um_filter_34_15]|nr:MAG: elongation factor P [Candidatus Pacebacteria bacterium CG1_02_43_31]PIQ81212.1 MAG: elongation factor P [Candidatus Pacebacteria bacterium CG11_big_fil_rev_8_21_14_0_20_34_55]PIX81782.1 MAG: elongation factor P [Candidatus Pacebacteria bacterium CG_4_10_14_3_um_filter_34_15]PJC43709.1 MAG: elongation factor P [Candidatus Pacebacteria bacterium CG_4_9_14_0_2_um_filter_34_50]